jgi:outer membrane protein TolC
MLRRTLLLGAVFALHSAAAFAQPAPVAPATTDVEPDARLPEVDDPMLAEVPPPRRVLTSWHQALGIARARASSLEISRAQIEQAQGVHRQTLARALPTLTGTGRIDYHLLTGEGPDFSTLPPAIRALPEPNPRWDAGLTLRVPVFAPQAWYNSGTASDSVRAAKLDAQETQRLVLAQVADAIVTVVTAERVAEVSRVSLGAGLSTLEL